jgi:hypothetical protein
MGRFVRLEIRLVIIGINLWRGGGAKNYAAFSRIFNRFVLPTALSRQPCLIGLHRARKRHAFRSKARLVPVLAFSGMWSASIAIAKRQLKQLRLFSRIGGFFVGGRFFSGGLGNGLAQGSPEGLMASRDGTGRTRPQAQRSRLPDGCVGTQ